MSGGTGRFGRFSAWGRGTNVLLGKDLLRGDWRGEETIEIIDFPRWLLVNFSHIDSASTFHLKSCFSDVA